MTARVTSLQRTRDLMQRRGTSARRILVVGPTDARLTSDPSGTDMIVHTQMQYLTRALLDKVRPDSILAPLVTRDWDVLDLAEVLTGQGYCGPLVIQSQPLPRADLVLGELQGLFPGLSVAFVERAD